MLLVLKLGHSGEACVGKVQCSWYPVYGEGLVGVENSGQAIGFLNG